MTSNGPFHVVLSSDDGGESLQWKVMDNQGRVHVSGETTMPSFDTGGGMTITLDFMTGDSEDVRRELGELPVDSAVVEGVVGSKFMKSLTEESGT